MVLFLFRGQVPMFRGNYYCIDTCLTEIHRKCDVLLVSYGVHVGYALIIMKRIKQFTADFTATQFQRQLVLLFRVARRTDCR